MKDTKGYKRDAIILQLVMAGIVTFAKDFAPSKVSEVRR